MPTKNALLWLAWGTVFAAGCSAAYKDRLHPNMVEQRPVGAAESAAAQAGLDAARALVTDLKYKEAAARLDRVVRSAAALPPPRAAEAVFWLAYCHEKLGDRETAVLQYKHVTVKYRDTPAARHAQRRLSALQVPRR